ncbi:MAG: 3-deoxy-7-phosphoheptulonate synthase [Spirochaetaceae bacterium]|jgi:3-deoxy-7-phosphoheptulonate synthase|nr:3-deoxy-7-phosphoheptulonate synthase [Spirochaetaceae bacterium]
MIIVIKPNAPENDFNALKERLKAEGFRLNVSRGEETLVLGLIGDASKINEEQLKANPIVENVLRVSAPYKLANRAFHPQNTIIRVKDAVLGRLTPASAGAENGAGKSQLCVMAGPCSVESLEQIISVAKAVKKSGARALRGGAFKPRTSPYSFQGMGAKGLELLKAARKETGLPIVTELMSVREIDLFQDIDIIQIGARNMQNFDLLKEVGGMVKPVLLKRGLSSTIKELLMSVEYLMSAGAMEIIICERGVRTFDSYTRNCLDVSAIPYLQKETHLPVVVDPSHACGAAWMTPALSKAAVAAGADGLLIEVHNNPACALCDGEQSLTPEDFSALMDSLAVYAAAEGRRL